MSSMTDDLGERLRQARRFLTGGQALRYWQAKELRDRVFTRWIARDFAAIGPRSTVSMPVRLFGSQGISLGSHVVLGPGCSLVCELGGRLVIGDGVYAPGGLTLIAHDRVEIGRDVMLAQGVVIVDNHHRSADRATPISAQGFEPARAVTVEDGAWLGVGVVVMPGVTIGRNAKVAANAVVTRDVSDYDTVAGVPARPLRSGPHLGPPAAR